MQDSYTVHPIGIFHSDAKYPYDVPRQGAVADTSAGVIRLHPNCHFEDALADLDGFDTIWVIFLFHQNQNWHPMVRPPRHTDRKVGLFATRSPYRPNPIGISAVHLERIQGLELWISRHDLLDGTPILDIKPYLPYADSFPYASRGWTNENPELEYKVIFSQEAERQLQWLENNGVPRIRSFLLAQLGYDPQNASLHRLIDSAIAYRTWRAFFTVDDEHAVTVTHILSGYSPEDLVSPDDHYGDKAIHREYNRLFP